MINTFETRLGLFFAVAVVAALLVVEMIGSLNFFSSGVRVYALFDKVQDLKEGDTVKLAGVPIGKVDGIDFADNRVRVALNLQDPRMVKTDSVATIKFMGLLGQNYVAVDFGSESAAGVEAGAYLLTQEQPDLSSIMAKLDNVASGVEDLTRSFSGDSINNLLGPFTDFLRENSPKLTGILSDVQRISAQIAEGQGTVGKVIFEQELYQTALTAVDNLNTTATDIRSTIADAQKIVSGVNEGQGTLGKLTQDPALYNEATTAMTNLREIFEKINRGEGSAGKLVNDESLYSNAKLTLQKVEKATEGLEDQGPLSVMGVLVNGLF